MVWESLTDGYYKGIKFHCSIPSKKNGVHGITSQKRSYERRLQLVKYPAKDGVKVRDFGGDSDVIEFDIIFSGSDYLKKYDDFFQTINDGQAGILICPLRPSAVVAYFHKISDTAEVGSGGTIRVSVSFVEDTTIDPNEIAPANVSKITSITDKASSLSEKIASAKKALNNNPLIDAVRELQSGISSVRRFANTVISLDQNIRNRIVSISSEINGTLDLIGDAVKVFKKDKSGVSNPSNVIDPETGLEVVPFDQEDTDKDDIELNVGEGKIPLEQTPATSDDPNKELSANNLNSNAGLEVFSTKANDILKDQRNEISSLGGGKTEDIVKSLTQVVLAVDEFKKSISVDVGIPVVVPNNLSMIEVMFYNDVPIEDLEKVISRNRHIEDVLNIPQGAVVFL